MARFWHEWSLQLEGRCRIKTWWLNYLTIEFSAALVVEYPPEKSELFGPSFLVKDLGFFPR